MKENEGRNGGTLKSQEKGDTKTPGSGRKKGTPNAKTRLDKLMQLSHTQINPITGVEEKADMAYFVDVALLKKALGSDVAAYKEIMDRMEGKSPQTNILQNPDGSPMQIVQYQIPDNERGAKD